MKGRKLRQVEGESRRGGDQASYILIYIFRTTITRCSVGGEFLFVQRRGLFSSFGRTIYITRFRFPIGSWNLSFRVLRFNNLRKQVSIFLKVPPSPLSLLCTTSGVHRAYSRETNRIG